MQVWGSLSAAASPMLISLAQPPCANGPAHTRACGVLYRIIKVWAVLYTARTRRMHLKEEGREGKEKRGGRKLSFKKCNEVEEGRTNKVQSMRAPGHTFLTEGISNRTAKGDKTRRDDYVGALVCPPRNLHVHVSDNGLLYNIMAPMDVWSGCT